MAFGNPSLPRAVRDGALLLVVGPIVLVTVMIVTQLDYPGYSLVTNAISDLGNTAQSPLWYVFSAGIFVAGILGVSGLVLLRTTFPAGVLRVTGLGALLVANLASSGIGLVPENVNGSLHSLLSLLVFLPGGVGLVAIGASMREKTGWGALRLFSIGLGVLTLVALVLALFTAVRAQYPGFIERLIVAPLLLWGIVIGVFVMGFQVRTREHAPAADG